VVLSAAPKLAILIEPANIIICLYGRHRLPAIVSSGAPGAQLRKVAKDGKVIVGQSDKASREVGLWDRGAVKVAGRPTFYLYSSIYIYSIYW
jgi:hypothetical protein